MKAKFLLNKKKWLAVAAVVLAIVGLGAFSLEHKTATQYFTAKVERGDVRDVVDATGTINAVTTVQVGSQVSGTIQKLNADFNSKVKAGQVVAIIDPSLFQGAVLQASADLQNSQANLASAKAELAKAQASATQMQSQFARTQALVSQGVLSRQQLDVDQANAQSGKAAVDAARAQVNQAAAQVAQKRAALTVAQTNLDHTIIRSPIDGTVVARSVDVGQTVAASLQAPTLFTIAQDLTKMQVYVATDESDVGGIKAGQPVTFKVDAFPQQTFAGKVQEVRMNATTVQNVVTYNTVVNFDNPEMKLFPGMTAYVSIPVASATDVVKVPNSALRYKPDMKPEEMQAIFAKYGMQAPQQRRAGGAAGQGARGGQNAQAANGAAATQRQSDVAVVWKQNADKSLEPAVIRTGLTDHTFTAVTQVLKGSLNPGDQLLTGAAGPAQKTASASPMAGGGRMR